MGSTGEYVDEVIAAAGLAFVAGELATAPPRT